MSVMGEETELGFDCHRQRVTLVETESVFTTSTTFHIEVDGLTVIQLHHVSPGLVAELIASLTPARVVA